MDKNTAYVAIYNGLGAESVINGTLKALGGSPDVELVDLNLDGQCIDFSKRLKEMGYRCRISAVSSRDAEDVSFRLSTICNEKIRDSMTERDCGCDLYIEAGGLNTEMSGAVYSAAFREGATAVFLAEDGRTLKKMMFEKAGDIGRVGFLPRMALNLLHENGRMDRGSLERSLYADKLMGLDESEITEFFKKNHNTYKIMGNLSKKGWVRHQKDADSYVITEKGETARVMMDIEERRSFDRF